eukprot:sb/3469238/
MTGDASAETVLSYSGIGNDAEHQAGLFIKITPTTLSYKITPCDTDYRSLDMKDCNTNRRVWKFAVEKVTEDDIEVMGIVLECNGVELVDGTPSETHSLRSIKRTECSALSGIVDYSSTIYYTVNTTDTATTELYRTDTTTTREGDVVAIALEKDNETINIEEFLSSEADKDSMLIAIFFSEIYMLVALSGCVVEDDSSNTYNATMVPGIMDIRRDITLELLDDRIVVYFGKEQTV